MKKQILSIAFVLCMLLTALPLTSVSAAATARTEGEKVQALINALPDADTITEENCADLEARLTAIDEAKLLLEDEERDKLDYTKYNTVIAALNVLDNMGGAEIPVTAEATAASYFKFDKTIGTITGTTDQSLTTIAIPDTIDGVAVTAIGRDAFRNCSSLTSITIPYGVTTIGREAFWNCSSLTSITISNSVTAIGMSAFGDCSSLTRITIPYGVTTIEVGAFSGCNKLTQINVDDSNTTYASIDGVVFDKAKSKIVIVPAGKSGEYTIPNSVTSIGANAFSECSSLTRITIPNGVTSIGTMAFSDCSGLTRITIPNGVTSIGMQAFTFCSSLGRITIPNGVKTIKSGTFNYCVSLASITIPNGVTSIERSAFHGCSSLTNAYYVGTNEEWSALVSKIEIGNAQLTNAVKCIAYNESVNLVYDGREKEVYTSQTDGVTIKYYQGTNEVSPRNAGTYTAKVGDDEIGTFTITKAEQNAPTGLSSTAETISEKADGKITGVTSAMEYRKDGTTDYTAIAGAEIAGLADGKYYVRYKADDNHNASDDTEITVAKGRKLTVTIPPEQIGYTLTVNKTELVWNDSVELTFALADGYSKLDTFAVKVNGNPIKLDKNGKFTITNAQSDITVTVVGVAADTTAPTGKISLGTNNWNTFLNNITFGLFFKDTQEVTIAAIDNSGEDVKIEYLLSNKRLTAEELATKTFTAYTGKFNIELNNEYVIYAKLSDKTGNAAYINSNGIVLDNVAPVITGITNGKTYCKAQTVTVSDNYDVTVTVNGTQVILDTNGRFTLYPVSGTQTVVATDKAGNVSAEMIVTINDGHEGGTPTCKDKAVCDYCGEPYGELNSSTHAGDTRIKNDKAATCTEDGYTGDTYCKGCDTKLSEGKPITKLGHSDENKDHICDVEICKAEISTHSGGTSTCKEQAICEHCGKPYGEYDTNRHKPKYNQVKAAAAAAIGNIEYWYCRDCNHYFSDKDCLNKMTQEDTYLYM